MLAEKPPQGRSHEHLAYMVPMIDKQLDQIYDTIDDLLLANKFSEIDAILECLEMDLGLDLLLGYFVATFPAKSKLKKRADFFAKLKATYCEEGLWKGLE